MAWARVFDVPLASGTRLGSYEVIAPLGAGGMGEVYRAHDTRLGRDVAIKLLPEALASSPDRLARLEREAKTVAGLNHPNIVTLHTIEQVGGVRFLVLELVEGRDLSTLIPPGGLPLDQVLDVAIPLADAIAAAHERRVIHRDLKPANVMLTRDGRLKVLDFGLAKLMEIGTDLGLTRAASLLQPISQAGQVVGTVPYMAPEQIRGEEADARSDLFSLGVLVYELATGKRPFAGQTSADVSSAILRDKPPTLTSIRADLPADLGRIVERCLEKNPRERFQTALDVSNELRGLKRALDHGPPSHAPAKSEKVASIAVLPFVNRSASPEDEYFSDGLGDELLNVLAKIKGLRVIARTSSSQFKNTSDDTVTIGRKLDVATLLEGSVRKAGNRIRISVQLVNVADSSHLWSETYDRTLEDIFAVQDDIARSVVKELRTTLLGQESDSKASGEVKAEVSRAVRGQAIDPEAHRLYLQARYLMARFTRADVEKAIEYLRQALELDPQFALGWTALAQSYEREASFSWTPMLEGYGRSREALDRALALDPDLAEAHAAMAWNRLNTWDWHGAEASVGRALELAPGEAAVLLRAASLASFQGRLDEAIEFYGRALKQDPLSRVAYYNLGLAFYAANRLVEAERACRKALELAPQASGTHAGLALVLLAQSRGEEAVAAAKSEPEEVFRLWALAIVHHVLLDRKQSDESLQHLIEKYANEWAFQVAEVYAARGEVDAAFVWLEHAYGQRDPGLNELKVRPILHSLHGDPRWAALLKKMGLAH